jgi:hypothetical protein
MLCTHALSNIESYVCVEIGEEVPYHLAILVACECFTTDEHKGTRNMQGRLSASSGVPVTQPVNVSRARNK